MLCERTHRKLEVDLAHEEVTPNFSIVYLREFEKSDFSPKSDFLPQFEKSDFFKKSDLQPIRFWRTQAHGR
jgi:hypothetical protein